MGLFIRPEHPSVAENRLGVDRIASEGASDDHIIGAIFFSSAFSYCGRLCLHSPIMCTYAAIIYFASKTI